MIGRRNFLQLLAAGAGSLVLHSTAETKERARRKPNIVYILVDDLGWTDLDVQGSSFYETPNIDRLAAQGMRFTNAYAACHVCSPTRASVLTGKYPARLHITDWISGHQDPHAKLSIPGWTQHLPHDEPTIAETLKNAGYRTGYIGKWHLGYDEYLPETHGFDVSIGARRDGRLSYFPPYGVVFDDEPKPGEYLADRLASEAERFIRDNRDRPFFLHFSNYAVHVPLDAKHSLIGQYARKAEADARHNNPVYAAMVHSVDECVGRIMDALRDHGIERDTIVIFTSDNGGLERWGPNWQTKVTSNAPLRAGKGTPYEGGVRVPMLVKWPRVVRPGSVCDTAVISNDFYPTLVDMAGATDAPEHESDGVSIVPLLEQTGDIEPRALYWHYPHYHIEGATPYGAIRKGDYRLIEFFEDNSIELYNLAEDIGETNDLSEAMPEKAQELLGDLRRWREEVGAQMPAPNPDYDPEKAGKGHNR